MHLTFRIGKTQFQFLFTNLAIRKKQTSHRINVYYSSSSIQSLYIFTEHEQTHFTKIKHS